MPEGLPILSEHEAPDVMAQSQGQNDVPEPTEEEEKAVKLVNHLFSKSKKHREKFDSKWLDYYKMFRGNQWKNKRPRYRHAEVVNFIFMHIQSQVPIMTDTRPRPSFLPQEPQDLEFSTILNDLFESDWQHGNWLYKVTETIFDAHFYGTGYGSLRWDPDAEFGLGRITHDSEDPFDIYPDPEARDVNDDKWSHYIVHAGPRDVEKMRAQYAAHPFVNAIKPDLVDFSKRDEKSLAYVRPQFQRQADKRLPAESFGSDPSLLTDKVMVFTIHMKPSDIIEEKDEQTDEAGNVTIRFISKKRFPKGRRIVMINNRIFEDGPLEDPEGRFPFSRLANYHDPRQFFGISEIEPLESPQKIFNKLMSFTLDVLTLAGNPIWLVPTASGVRPGSFHNAPGMQVPYDGKDPPRRVEGVQLQPYIIQMIDRMVAWFNDISGSQDITRGVNPPSVTAAAAIENLQDAAQTRVRQKMRNLDSYLVELGRQYVNLALKYYDTPRIFRLTAKDGSEKFFKMHVEPLEEELRDPQGQILLDENGEVQYIAKMDDKGDPVRVAVVRGFSQDQEGNVIEEAEEKRMLIRGNFDVKVNTGTGLPFSKAEKEQRLLQLFDRGIIDAEEVLTQIEFPNAEAVLERVKALAEAQAQAAQQESA